MALFEGPGLGEPLGSWPGPLFSSPLALWAGRAGAGEPYPPPSQETPCDQRPWSHPQALTELRSRAWLEPAPARSRTVTRVPTVAKRRICRVISLSLHRGAGRTFMARRSASCKPSRAASPACGKFSHEPGSGPRRPCGRPSRGDFGAREREQGVSLERAAGSGEICGQDIKAPDGRAKTWIFGTRAPRLPRRTSKTACDAMKDVA